MQSSLSESGSHAKSVFDRCRWRCEHVLSWAFVFSTLVAAADYLTGDEYPLIICYLPCIMMVCWCGRTAIAVVLAIACCTVWMVDDLVLLERPSITGTQIWISASHLIFYLVLISVLMRLRAAYEREASLARIDALTGLSNGREFHIQAVREHHRAQRTGDPLAVAYIDCDNFKQVNDRFGHCVGDRLLKEVAQTMQESLRADDTAARIGGDEFAILMPSTNRDGAETVVNRIRERLADVMDANQWPVTLSIGVAVYESVPMTVDEMIRGADSLMYEVKKNQKDAVVFKLCV